MSKFWKIKREAGASPARYRHCDGEAFCSMPLAEILPGRRKGPVTLSQETCLLIAFRMPTVYGWKDFLTGELSRNKAFRPAGV